MLSIPWRAMKTDVSDQHFIVKMVKLCMHPFQGPACQMIQRRNHMGRAAVNVVCCGYKSFVDSC